MVFVMMKTTSSNSSNAYLLQKILLALIGLLSRNTLVRRSNSYPKAKTPRKAEKHSGKNQKANPLYSR